MLDKFLDYFDKRNLTPRSAQVEVLEQLSKQWEAKKYIIISAPTRSW